LSVIQQDILSGKETVIVSHAESIFSAQQAEEEINKRLLSMGIVGNPTQWEDDVINDLTIDVCQEVMAEFQVDVEYLGQYKAKHGHLPRRVGFQIEFRNLVAWVWGYTNQGLRFDHMMNVHGANPKTIRCAFIDNFRDEVNEAIEFLELERLEAKQLESTTHHKDNSAKEM